MFFALVIFLVLLSVLAHELGHAIAMRSRGIPIEEIGIGLKLPFIPHLRFEQRAYRDDGTHETELPAFAIHPLLITAYVRPTEEGERRLAALSDDDASLVCGAGVIASLLCSVLFAEIYLVVFAGVPVSVLATDTLFLSSTFFVIAALAGGKIFIPRYIMPVTGALLLGFIGANIVRAPMETIGGPVMVWQIMKSAAVGAPDALTVSFGPALTAPEQAFIFASLFSLGIAAFNMLPLEPLDGGKVVSALLRRSAPHLVRPFLVWSVAAFLCLVFLALTTDVIRLLF